jgi:hypothetical protein
LPRRDRQRDSYRARGRITAPLADCSIACAAHPTPRAAPDQAASLFGRGVAWALKGDKAKAAADVVAAEKQAPFVKAQFESFGIALPQ